MKREQQDWVSRSVRRNVSHPGTAHLGDGSNVDVSISNLSGEGCKISCGTVLEVGEVIKVAVPGLGTMNAQVRWTAERKAGLSFLSGI